MSFRIGKLIVIATMTALLSSCFVYRQDIQQGNEITAQMVSGLEMGMSRREVTQILGAPLIKDPFHKDRWDFYYSRKNGKTGKTERHFASLIFKDDRLAEISSSFE